MTLHKLIPLANLIWWYVVGLILIITIFGVFWNIDPSIKTVFMTIDTFVIWSAMVFLFYLKQHLKPYTYIVTIPNCAEGIAVWANGLPVDKLKMEKAIEFFINEFSAKVGLNKLVLTYMLASSTVEWRNTKLSILGFDKATGYQKGKSIILYWPGSIEHSALFHELVHLVDEEWRKTNNLPYKKDSDHNHAWWVFLDQLQRGWVARH